MTASDTLFAGSIPSRYDRYLGPLLFQPYADEVAERARALAPRDILETAAGTGIVTEALHRLLPDASIVATDLNCAMLDVARQRTPAANVRFEPADAQALPFDDESFDFVVCQLGVMFFPNKPKANSEVRRVLRAGGTYLAIIWDTLESNPVSRAVHEAVVQEFPGDPPRFLARGPFGYADKSVIEADMRAGGFTKIAFETVGKLSLVHAEEAALGMCCGSPLNAEIMERDPSSIDRVVASAERAVTRFDGAEAPMSALFVTATKFETATI